MDDAQIAVLISEVQSEPSIWDLSDSSYKNLKYKGKLWTKISNHMRLSKPVLQNKWKSLVKKYKSELSKTKAHRSGDGLEDLYQSNWPFYPHLDFLKKSVTPEESSGNLDSLFENEYKNSNDQKNINMSVNQDEKTALDNLKIIQNAIAQKLQSTDKKNYEEMDKENMAFFTTLVPQLRNIPTSEICYFRAAILKVAHSFAHKDQSWQDINFVRSDPNHSSEVAENTAFNNELIRNPFINIQPYINKIKIEKESLPPLSASSTSITANPSASSSSTTVSVNPSAPSASSSSTTVTVNPGASSISIWPIIKEEDVKQETTVSRRSSLRTTQRMVLDYIEID